MKTLGISPGEHEDSPELMSLRIGEGPSIVSPSFNRSYRKFSSALEPHRDLLAWAQHCRSRTHEKF